MGRQISKCFPVLRPLAVPEDILVSATSSLSSGSRVYRLRRLQRRAARELIAKYADNKLVDAVATRHRHGKLLIVAIAAK